MKKRLLFLCFWLSVVSMGSALAEQEVKSESMQSIVAPEATEKSQAPQTTDSNSITAIKKPTLKKPVALPQNSSLLPQLLQITLALLFVVGLIISIAWLFRRFGQQQYSVKGDFRIVGGVHLSTREKVVLLQMGKQQLLLGVAPGRVNILHVLDEPLDLTSTTPIGESAFAKKLSSLLQGKTQ